MLKDNSISEELGTNWGIALINYIWYHICMKVIKTFYLTIESDLILKKLKYTSGKSQSALVDEAIKLLVKPKEKTK